MSEYASDFVINDGTVVISARLVSSGDFEVVTRTPSNMVYASNPPQNVPDTIKKMIYRVVEGKITLVSTKVGRHTPSHYVSEKIEFDS